MEAPGRVQAAAEEGQRKPPNPDKLARLGFDRDGLLSGCERAGLDQRTADLIVDYAGLVEADQGLPEKVRKGVWWLCIDSLAGLELDQIRNARRVVDIGTGVGFPGMILALALPDHDIALIEQNPSRCEFMRYAIERLRITNVEVSRTMRRTGTSRTERSTASSPGTRFGQR